MQSLDARVKLVVALLLIAGTVLTPPHALPAYPLLWALIASLAATSRVGILRLGKRSGIAIPFALAALTLLFTTPGAPITSVFGLAVTDEGLIRFGSILIKSWLAVQVSILLTLTTPFDDLLGAMGSIGVPRTLILITTFFYRYLTTLTQEADRLRTARASRSASIPDYRSGGGLMWRAQVAGNMVGNLFLRSYERSERVYAAMLSRGFDGHFHAVDLPPLSRHSVAMGALPLIGLVVIEALAFTLWRA